MEDRAALLDPCRPALTGTGLTTPLETAVRDAARIAPHPAVAASLLQSTNDHSHACFDEARPDLRPEPCERYAVVFERIFEGHSPSHLRAMRSLLDPPTAGFAANGPPA